MQDDRFAWAPNIPREMFEDKEFLYSVLPAEWEQLLREAGGIRLPGPVHMQVMEYGYIDDDSLEPVIMDVYNVRVRFVVVRVIGPAMRP